MQHIDLRNIKINQIQIFLEAVNCGSFSGAAEALHVTQPMVSKTIQALEKELGIILFIRRKGKLNLTPAGRDCYNQWFNMLKISGGIRGICTCDPGGRFFKASYRSRQHGDQSRKFFPAAKRV